MYQVPNNNQKHQINDNSQIQVSKYNVSQNSPIQSAQYTEHKFPLLNEIKIVDQLGYPGSPGSSKHNVNNHIQIRNTGFSLQNSSLVDKIFQNRHVNCSFINDKQHQQFALKNNQCPNPFIRYNNTDHKSVAAGYLKTTFNETFKEKDISNISANLSSQLKQFQSMLKSNCQVEEYETGRENTQTQESHANQFINQNSQLKQQQQDQKENIVKVNPDTKMEVVKAAENSYQTLLKSSSVIDLPLNYESNCRIYDAIQSNDLKQQLHDNSFQSFAEIKCINSMMLDNVRNQLYQQQQNHHKNNHQSFDAIYQQMFPSHTNDIKEAIFNARIQQTSIFLQKKKKLEEKRLLREKQRQLAKEKEKGDATVAGQIKITTTTDDSQSALQLLKTETDQSANLKFLQPLFKIAANRPPPLQTNSLLNSKSEDIARDSNTNVDAADHSENENDNENENEDQNNNNVDVITSNLILSLSPSPPKQLQQQHKPQIYNLPSSYHVPLARLDSFYKHKYNKQKLKQQHQTTHKNKSVTIKLDITQELKHNKSQIDYIESLQKECLKQSFQNVLQKQRASQKQLCKMAAVRHRLSSSIIEKNVPRDPFQPGAYPSLPIGIDFQHSINSEDENEKKTSIMKIANKKQVQSLKSQTQGGTQQQSQQSTEKKYALRSADNVHYIFQSKITFDSWKPDIRESATCVCINNKIYMFGGCGNGIYDDLQTLCKHKQKEFYYWISVKIEDPEHTPNQVIPFPRHGHSMTAFKNKFIIFGGELKYNKEMKTRMVTNEMWQFHTELLKWTKILNHDYLESRRNHSASAVGSVLLILGGVDSKDRMLNDFWAFDINSTRWFQSQPQNLKRYFEEGIAFHQSVDVFCPERKSVQLYQELTGTVEPQYQFLHEGVFFFGGKSLKGRIYDQLIILKTNQRNLAFYEPETLGKPPKGRYHHQMHCNNMLGILVVNGGKAKDQFLGDICILRLYNFNWTTVSYFGSPVQPRAAHCAVLDNSQYILLGGMNMTGFLDLDLYIIELDSIKAKKMRLDETLKKQSPTDEAEIRKELRIKNKQFRLQQLEQQQTILNKYALKQITKHKQSKGVENFMKSLQYNNFQSFLPLPRQNLNIRKGMNHMSQIVDQNTQKKQMQLTLKLKKEVESLRTVDNEVVSPMSNNTFASPLNSIHFNARHDTNIKQCPIVGSGAGGMGWGTKNSNENQSADSNSDARQKSQTCNIMDTAKHSQQSQQNKTSNLANKIKNAISHQLK